MVLWLRLVDVAAMIAVIVALHVSLLRQSRLGPPGGERRRGGAVSRGVRRRFSSKMIKDESRQTDAVWRTMGIGWFGMVAP
ncbi:hypothetical protein [Alicyclobacillus sendaiensis]|uniref:Secreted protein n=1 Tax=Alicyclobacillus sendaiensis PA2 TaxID=3029425 RepID=A0ABT6Y006_ALISE|nr:hypothetical protein [Alicyclobacillus sendaiensis]MDI9260665.1 hypothetical protein [Alicyclobacillus sendaiensis PA2]